METKVFVVRTWDDLVFATRNREYGAYSLRQEYTKRLLIALGLSTSMIIALLFLPRLFPESKKLVPICELPIRGLIDIKIYKPPVKEGSAELIRESSVKTNNTNKSIRVVRDEVTPLVDEVSTPIDQTGSGEGASEGDPEGISTGVATQPVTPAISQGPMLVAEIMPSMPVASKP